MHEQDNEDNQNNILNEIVEFIPQDNTPNHSINETDESNLLVHIAQPSTPIKDAKIVDYLVTLIEPFYLIKTTLLQCQHLRIKLQKN